MMLLGHISPQINGYIKCFHCSSKNMSIMIGNNAVFVKQDGF